MRKIHERLLIHEQDYQRAVKFVIKGQGIEWLAVRLPGSNTYAYFENVEHPRHIYYADSLDEIEKKIYN